MWLHVRGADGTWRRYALDLMKNAGGAVGVTVFPLGVFDDQNQASGTTALLQINVSQ